MITLNTEQGLVKVDTWEAIEDLVGFIRNLDPKEHALQEIIGRYGFKERIACGLSTCHKPHGKGYIVRTKDGRITNIGKDCGKTYFGVDFETMSRQFDRSITESENRDRLWSFSFQLDEFEREIGELREGRGGANWVYKHAQQLVNRNAGCPEEVVRRILDMVKTRTSTLVGQRPATESEIELKEAMLDHNLARPHYVDYPLGDINGLQTLYPENNLRDLLINNLVTKIKDFKSLDIDSLPYAKLAEWVHWVDSAEDSLKRARHVVQMGNLLLAFENLKPLEQIITTRSDKNTFRDYLKSIKE